MMQGSTGPISRVQRAVGLEIIEKLAVILEVGPAEFFGRLGRSGSAMSSRGKACPNRARRWAGSITCRRS
jgi:hypothetical protein